MLGRVEAAGYTENDVDVQIVSELVDDIRDAVTDYQVSGDPKQFIRALSLRQNWSRRSTNRPYTTRISN